MKRHDWQWGLGAWALAACTGAGSGDTSSSSSATSATSVSDGSGDGTMSAGPSTSNATADGTGSGAPATGDATTGTGETAAEAIDRCLAEGSLTLDCPAPGDAMRAFAFDEPVGPTSAVCGGLDVGSPAPLGVIMGPHPSDPSGLVVFGVRLRAPVWDSAVDGEWWELLAPAPIEVTADAPLAAVQADWRLHLLTTPFGAGFLFQEGESTDVEVTFAAPVTVDDILDGTAVRLDVTWSGGRYLRIDTNDDSRELFDDATALGIACIHAPATTLPFPESFATTACGPDFDTCPDGYQACAASASDTLFVCAPASTCDADCGFGCGAVGGGSCLPPWGPGI